MKLLIWRVFEDNRYEQIVQETSFYLFNSVSMGIFMKLASCF